MIARILVQYSEDTCWRPAMTTECRTTLSRAKPSASSASWVQNTPRHAVCMNASCLQVGARVHRFIDSSFQLSILVVSRMFVGSIKICELHPPQHRMLMPAITCLPSVTAKCDDASVWLIMQQSRSIAVSDHSLHGPRITGTSTCAKNVCLAAKTRHMWAQSM